MDPRGVGPLSLKRGHEVRDEAETLVLRYHFKHRGGFILFERTGHNEEEKALGVLRATSQLAGYRLYDVAEVEEGIATLDVVLTSDRQEAEVPVRDHVSGEMDMMTVDAWVGTKKEAGE